MKAGELEEEFAGYDDWTPQHQVYEPALDEDDEKEEPVEELKDVDDLDLNRHLSAKVQIPRAGYDLAVGKVVRRSRGTDGELIGKTDSNPLLDTSQYEVEFEDGSVEKCSANIIAEHIYAQLDDDVYTWMLMDEIVDHWSNPDAVPKREGKVRGPNGTWKAKQTTKGWELCVRWKDSSTEWVSLRD